MGRIPIPHDSLVSIFPKRSGKPKGSPSTLSAGDTRAQISVVASRSDKLNYCCSELEKLVDICLSVNNDLTRIGGIINLKSRGSGSTSSRNCYQELMNILKTCQEGYDRYLATSRKNATRLCVVIEGLTNDLLPLFNLKQENLSFTRTIDKPNDEVSSASEIFKDLLQVSWQEVNQSEPFGTSSPEKLKSSFEQLHSQLAQMQVEDWEATQSPVETSPMLLESYDSDRCETTARIDSERRGESRHVLRNPVQMQPSNNHHIFLGGVHRIFVKLPTYILKPFHMRMDQSTQGVPAQNPIPSHTCINPVESDSPETVIHDDLQNIAESNRLTQNEKPPLIIINTDSDKSFVNNEITHSIQKVHTIIEKWDAMERHLGFFPLIWEQLEKDASYLKNLVSNSQTLDQDNLDLEPQIQIEAYKEIYKRLSAFSVKIGTTESFPATSKLIKPRLGDNL